jgi:predicted nucleic acid-binding protein
MVAYDTNILIYALEGRGPWAAAAQDLVRQGENDGAVLSVLARQELMTGAVLRGGTADKLVEVLSELRATEFAPVTEAVCDRAVALTESYGKKLYGYDAIHIATAIERGAEAFVTNDKALLGLNITELQVRGLVMDIEDLSKHVSSFIKPGTKPLVNVDEYYQANRKPRI